MVLVSVVTMTCLGGGLACHCVCLVLVTSSHIVSCSLIPGSRWRRWQGLQTLTWEAPGPVTPAPAPSTEAPRHRSPDAAHASRYTARERLWLGGCVGAGYVLAPFQPRSPPHPGRSSLAKAVGSSRASEITVGLPKEASRRQRVNRILVSPWREKNKISAR